MGRRWKKRGGKNKTRGAHKGSSNNPNDTWSSSQQGGNTKDWIASVVSAGNAQMEAFYAAQGLHDYSWNNDSNELKKVETLEEWQAERLAWRASMGQVLPASFRIHRDLPEEIQQELSQEFQSLLKQTQEAKDEDDNPLCTHDGTGQPKARQLSFLPNDSIGFQLNVDRTSLRKHARLKPLHEWLKRVTDAGYVTRQETVSMIPPAVLKPNASDTVLDMCAAPGSKTLQLLEQLTNVNGCVVANDANPERAALLTHQLKRVLSRNPACLVTACPAQFFPASVTKFTAAGGFDKILADVPCTGDGTSRKNIDVWRKWTVRSALTLHPLQLQIASRGVQLLRKAPAETFLCYSTCSQSPVENEAVVAELLRRYNELELVKVELPGFRTRPGMTTWKIFDVASQPSRRERAKQAQEEASKREEEEKINTAGDVESKEPVETKESTEEESKEKVDENEPKDVLGAKQFDPKSMDEAVLMDLAKQAGLIYYETHDSVPANAQKRIRPTVFPPTNSDDMHLDRCLRVLPHDNDTGGFFVALLRKKNEAPSPRPPDKKRARVDDEKDPTEQADSVVDDDMEEIAKDSDDGDGEDVAGDLDADNKPVRKRNDKALKGVEAFVPVTDEIFDPLIEYYGLDASPSFRKDYFMCRVGGDSKIIHYVCPPIKAILDTGIQEKIHVLSGSIKAFSRNSLQQGCPVTHRVAQEAVSFVAPLMTKRKVMMKRDDFDRCLIREAVPISELSAELQDVIKPMSVGSIVAVLQDERLPSDADMLAIVIWRCRAETLKLLVTANDMDEIKRRCVFLLGPSTVKPPVTDKPNDPNEADAHDAEE